MCYLAWEKRLSFAQGYDPFEVLGIPYGSTEEEIRKQYRILSLKFHPDRVGENEKETAEIKFVQISKAYKALTDDDIRRNYEETGNPDGIRNMTLGIALPSWLVEQDNTIVVLAIYGLIFGLGFPFIIGRWWYHSKAYSKANIHYRTMGLFYKELTEAISATNLIEILCAATEFQELVQWTPKDTQLIPELFNRVKAVYESLNNEKLEKNKRFTAPYTHKSFVLFMAYIYRVPVVDPSLLQAQQIVIETCLRLLEGMLQIAIAKDWVDVVMTLIKFQEMLIQAVFSSSCYLLQVPCINLDLSTQFGKISLGEGKYVRFPKDLLQVPKEELKTLLKSVVGSNLESLDVACSNVLRVAASIPKIVLVKPVIQVIGQEKITPGSLVTVAFYVTLATNEEEEKRVKEKDSILCLASEELVSVNFKSGKQASAKSTVKVSNQVSVHCPYYFTEKTASWWAILSMGGAPNTSDSTRSLVTTPQKIREIPLAKNYLEKNSDVASSSSSAKPAMPPAVLLQFSAPPHPGPLFLSLDLRSDSWLNCDFHCDIKINIAADETSTATQQCESDEEFSDVSSGIESE